MFLKSICNYKDYKIKCDFLFFKVRKIKVGSNEESEICEVSHICFIIQVIMSSVASTDFIENQNVYHIYLYHSHVLLA